MEYRLQAGSSFYKGKTRLKAVLHAYFIFPSI